jgi:hypothetical protein
MGILKLNPLTVLFVCFGLIFLYFGGQTSAAAAQFASDGDDGEDGQNGKIDSYSS